MIEVACAIIRSGNKTLVVQRSETMPLPLKWEFPGGKIEAGETAEECLVREIREELSCTVQIIGKLGSQEYSYPNLSIRLIPFIAEISEGAPKLQEHIAFLWLDNSQLKPLDWAAADIAVMEAYLQLVCP